MSAKAKRLLRPAIRPSSWRPRTQSERGASMVEFALVLSLLFMLVFGIIQFGIAFNRYQGIQAAAREGARIASVGGSQADVRQRVHQAQSLFTAADVQVSMHSSDDDGSSWSSPICDDGSGNKCDNTMGSSPCTQAGIGNLIRVTATVPGAGGKYAIIIPLWGNADVTYRGQGIFRCEEGT